MQIQIVKCNESLENLGQPHNSTYLTAKRLHLKAQGWRFGNPGVTELNSQFNRKAVASTNATRSGLRKMFIRLPRVEIILGCGTQPLRGISAHIYF
jgi:hypothetical protein